MKRSAQNNSYFRELATLIDAGITPAHAIKKLGFSSAAWQSAYNNTERGYALSNALFQAKLVSKYEKELLAISETSGQLTSGLKQLAQIAEKRDAQVSKLRSKLVLPSAVLLVAIIVSNLLNALSGASAAEIILTVALQLGSVLVILKFIFSLIRKNPNDLLNTFSAFNGLRIYQLAFQQIIFSGLLWMYRAGVDFESAFRKLGFQLQNKQYQRELHSIAHKCSTGQSVVSSLLAANLPLNSSFLQILQSAEVSGSRLHTLEHKLLLDGQELELRIDQIFEWIPRLLYSVVAVIAIAVIFR